MSAVVPELRALLESPGRDEHDRAWSDFLDTYSRLLLQVARTVARDHDDAMDGYAHVLEQLRADQFARLRTFAADGRAKFSTWLVVVARRLCLDRQRQRYGRTCETASDVAEREQVFRRRLQQLAGEDVEWSDIAEDAPDAHEVACAAEVRDALDAALATLDPGDRVLLKRRFEDDLSAAEIARVLHFRSPFHVYRRLDTIIATLRRLLTDRGVESSIP
jgi:RNA polymerase sigma factor (sigma-70 family)